MSEHDENEMVYRVAREWVGGAALEADCKTVRSILAALKPGDRLPGGDNAVMSRRQMLDLAQHCRGILALMVRAGEAGFLTAGDLDAARQHLADMDTQIAAATTNERGQNADDR